MLASLGVSLGKTYVLGMFLLFLNKCQRGGEARGGKGKLGKFFCICVLNIDSCFVFLLIILIVTASRVPPTLLGC